jgi:hypothetical protein
MVRTFHPAQKKVSDLSASILAFTVKIWGVKLPSPPKSSCVYYELLGEIDIQAIRCPLTAKVEKEGWASRINELLYNRIDT